jgi:type I restriction enzyme S subunit
VRLKDVTYLNRHILAETTPAEFAFKYVDIAAVRHSGEVVLPANAVSFGSAPARARRLAAVGATVVSTVRTYLRAIGQVPGSAVPLVFSTGFAVLEAGPQVNPDYLYYLCRSDPFIHHVVTYSVGVSYPAVNPGDLGTFPVDLPPLEDQRRIADFLGAQVARLAGIGRARSRQIRLLRERRVAEVRAALDLPNVETVELRRAGVSVTTGPFGTVFAATEYVSGGIPMINPVHIRDGVLEPDEQHTVAPSTAVTRLRRHRLRRGDLVVGRKGDIGRSALVREEQDGWICGSDSIALHTAGSKLDSRYLAHLLSLPEIRAQLLERSAAATMPSLSEGNLLQLRVPIPSRPEQERMIAEVDAIDSWTRSCVAAMQRQVALTEERQQALITAAVTGLDVTTAREAR